jgi:hypothetical protein
MSYQLHFVALYVKFFFITTVSKHSHNCWYDWLPNPALHSNNGSLPILQWLNSELTNKCNKIKVFELLHFNWYLSPPFVSQYCNLIWFVSHHNCSEDLWRFFIQHTFCFLWVSSTKYYYVINNICF